MDKDWMNFPRLVFTYVGFNPWFNGLMDKDLTCEGLIFVRRICFNPWFNGLMDKDMDGRKND